MVKFCAEFDDVKKIQTPLPRGEIYITEIRDDTMLRCGSESFVACSIPRYGMNFTSMEFQDILPLALKYCDYPRLFFTCNLNHLRNLQRDFEFRRAYVSADVVTLDSRWLKLLIKFKTGLYVPLVTGSDLFPAIMAQLHPVRDRPFFVASSRTVGQSLSDQLIARGFNKDSVAFDSPKIGFDQDDACSSQMVEKIRNHGATHVFMGVGSPKSEKWVHNNLQYMPACNIFCIGAALDFFVGAKRRAPSFLQKLGMEWLHRLLNEPRRLGSRYFGDALFFLQLMCGKALISVVPHPMRSESTSDLINV